MYFSSLDILPQPYNSMVFGGAAGVITATAALAYRKRGKSSLVREAGALPGVPEGASAREANPADVPRKSIERDQLLRRYDRAFTEMLARQEAHTRSEALERMKQIMYELSPEIKAWTGDARIRAYVLLKELAKGLDDPASSKASLDLIFLLLSKGGNSAMEMAKPMLKEKIKHMYAKSAHDSERFLPRLLLMLDDYDPEAVERLARDAIHAWGDERFSAAWQYLGLEELRERGLRNRLRDVLGEEIAKAGTERNITALNRAVELYHAVK
ncbi:MAG TPA: hypothetical protein VGS04_04200 [Nitrososphaerales archaeon]|nr:hypothetical protein [Nitrososphaerales archaeon]